jgi:hypothetical protein
MSDATREHLGRLAICSWHGVRTHVERRRCSCVCKSSRNYQNGDARLEHLRCHEVAKIAQSKVRPARFATTPNEGLRHPVRKPRLIAVRAMGEDESMQALFVDTLIGRELLQREYARPIERDPMRAPGLGGREHRTRWTLGIGALNGEASAFDVGVCPPQCQELSSTRARRRAEQKEEMESRACILNGSEKHGKLRRARWADPRGN